MPKVKKNLVTHIDGYIIPKNWDKSGNVVQVVIETDEFERYIVAENDQSRDLLNFINQRVRIKCHLTGEHFDGNQVIFVTEVQLDD